MSSSQATCRKCDSKVPKEEVRHSAPHSSTLFRDMGKPLTLSLRWLYSLTQIRIGLVMNAGRFGIQTRWQHLPCTVFSGVATVTDIEGYEYLEGQCRGHPAWHAFRPLTDVAGLLFFLPEEQQAAVRERLQQSTTEVDEDMQPLDPSELVRPQLRWHPSVGALGSCVDGPLPPSTSCIGAQGVVAGYGAA